MDEKAEQLAELYSIFSNAKRILIFWALSKQELSVNEIAQLIGASAQNTSQHLRLMKAKNILETRREGQTIYHRISDSEEAGFCRALHQEHVHSH